MVLVSGFSKILLSPKCVQGNAFCKKGDKWMVGTNISAIDQEGFQVPLTLTKLWTGFFKTIGPWTPFTTFTLENSQL